MSKIINEELSRMFYLLDHKRGVVVSEQVTPATASPATAAPTTAAPTTAAPTTAAANPDTAANTINYPNGDIYTGAFTVRGKDKIRNGQGTLIYDGGNAKYVGNFKDNNFNGQGTLTFPNQPGIEYTGNYINNGLNGQGTLKNSDGTYYVGNFKNNMPDGNGIKYNADGSILEQGNFAAGNYQGNSNTTTPAGGTATTTTSAPQEYVVQKGDTLGKIGQKFGVQWKEIATLNQIKNVNLIRVGQKLKIPGKTQTAATTTTTATQTNATTVPTDIVSAAGTDVENLITQLFAKMPSFKTFGKYKDAGGMLKGIASNLTEAEIKQKNPTTLINLPITGFKFYTATEGRPFTKETYNVLTADGRVYVQYLNDVKIETANPEEVPKEDVTDPEVKKDIKVSNQTKRADRKICRIVRKGIKNNTDMSSMLGDVCQVLELCKTGGFIDKSVTLEACKKVDTETENTQEKPLSGGKIIEDPLQAESVINTRILY
jgi:LysM repeat protein